MSQTVGARLTLEVIEPADVMLQIAVAHPTRNAESLEITAEGDALIDGTDRQPTGPLLAQHTGDFDRAMTIGIGFDDSHDLGWRSQLAQPFQVVAQRAQVNGGDSSATHDPDLIEPGAFKV